MIAGALMIATIAPLTIGARTFTHPGLSYTETDLQRMRKGIQEKNGQMAATFEALKASPWSRTDLSESTPVTAIGETQFNNYVGRDGRRVHDLALLYRLTDDTAYADQAVRILNRYKDLTNCSARGTAPLDNGKIYLMIEGAELLRDYPGWADADRQDFADMLVYPGYSSTAFPDGHRDAYDDEANDITFYWNIYNFDTGRFGNQGLFAARAMMAMGIFLDNEKMYDRAMNYLMSRPAREDDLPYSNLVPTRGSLRSESESMRDYNVTWAEGDSQFISDEALQYYIYSNGQCQEACRDQGHTLVGVGLYTDLAEMSKNQGDDLYGALDSRILRGLEYACRYNLGEGDPTGYSKDENDCTFDNGIFYQADSRSQRWEAIAPAAGDRGAFDCVRYLTQALMHYSNRVDLAADDYQWLEKAWQKCVAENAGGIEDWGEAAHFYEWKGWGTLTKWEPKQTQTSAPAITAEISGARYYDLNGVRVAEPKNGIYVKVQNNTAKITVVD